MNTRLIIDKAGRIVIPKPLREELHLEAGDALEMESAGEQITLRPMRGPGPLTKEHGVWVFHAGQPCPPPRLTTCCNTSGRIAISRISARANEGVFDTSVLVPVFYGDHVHHKTSLDLFIQFDKSTGCCGAHSLAEVYSTLTRMSGKHRISGEQALLFVGSIRERLSIIGMSGDEYSDALTASATSGIVGGGIYDAMLAHCALKAKAETIYTWNGRHYSLCGPNIIQRLRTP